MIENNEITIDIIVSTTYKAAMQSNYAYLVDSRGYLDIYMSTTWNHLLVLLYIGMTVTHVTKRQRIYMDS
jgi:hypothetical protein